MSAHRGEASGAEGSAADFSAVLRGELERIRIRRRAAGQPANSTAGGRDRCDNLVGLALSGGGIRSAALSLGLLQALSRNRLLSRVDYLSTVSGGGLAGGYLSSCSIKGQQRQSRRRGDDRETGSAAGGADPPRSEAPASSGFLTAEDSSEQSRQVRRFLFGGNFLHRTWLFLNGYMIGLLLIWLVVISGLIAAASFTAWLFRCTDYLNFRLWLNAVGFDGDLKAAFFPAFVAFWIWIALWLVSYFKFGSRATGTCARYAFIALLLLAAIGVAALLGTGDIDVASVTKLLGIRLSPETLQWIDSLLRTVILTSIGASLLPYFTFSRLLRSGQEPKTGWEKWAFWIATRGLLFGVPLVLVGYFAKENISGYHERRDERLYKDDVEWQWRESPLWHQVRDYVPAPPGEGKNTLEDAVGNVFRDQKTLRTLRIAFREYEEHMLLLGEANLRPGEVAKLGDPNYDAGYADPLEPIAVEGLTPLSRRRDDLIAADLQISFVQRWWLLTRWGMDALFGRMDQIRSNPVYQIYAAHCGRWGCQEKIVELLNRQIERPDFYRILLPNSLDPVKSAIGGAEAQAGTEADGDSWALLARQLELEDPDANDGKLVSAWVSELMQLRAEAERLGMQWGEAKITFEPDASVSQLQSARQRMVSDERLEESIIAANRSLLKAFYGKDIRDKSVKLSVVHRQDQRTRLRWFFTALCVFLVAGLVVDLNATSWHGYYGERIAQTWIERVPGFGKHIPLARLKTTAAGDPYHLINASIHLVGRRDDRDDSPKIDHFLFSELYCGSERTGFGGTNEFLDGKFRLDDALAVSGAAVTPILPANPLVAMLLVLFNVRFDQWVPNPGHRAARPGRTRQRWPVSPLRVAVDGLKLARQRRFCLVADGGHHDNLGIRPLLRRRCKLILACDASHDEGYQFAELSRALRWARVMDGIEFASTDPEKPRFDLSPVTPDKSTRRASAPYLIARIRYPETRGRGKEEGLLVYMKSVLCGDEPADLLQYSEVYEAFPHDSPSDQFYDETRMEAYRQLGHHIGEKVSARLRHPEDAETWNVCETLAESLSGDESGSEGRSAADEAAGLPADVQEWLRELAHPSIPAAMQRDPRKVREAESRVRAEVAEKLASVEDHDPLIVDALLDALFAESDPYFQGSCRIELCERLPAMAEALPGRFDDPSWRVRRQCVLLVHDAVTTASRAPAGVQLLRKLMEEIVKQALRDSSKSVRKAAQDAAGSFASKFRDEPAATELIDELRSAISRLGEETGTG